MGAVHPQAACEPARGLVPNLESSDRMSVDARVARTNCGVRPKSIGAAVARVKEPESGAQRDFAIVVVVIALRPAQVIRRLPETQTKRLARPYEVFVQAFALFIAAVGDTVPADVCVRVAMELECSAPAHFVDFRPAQNGVVRTTVCNCLFACRMA
jgi:hypothetical protein